MTCSSSCSTQDHESWGACVRAKGLKVAYAQEHAGKDATQQKKADKNLDAYANARKYGIQPATTRPVDVQRAVQMSDKTGRAFQA